MGENKNKRKRLKEHKQEEEEEGKEENAESLVHIVIGEDQSFITYRKSLVSVRERASEREREDKKKEKHKFFYAELSHFSAHQRH